MQKTAYLSLCALLLSVCLLLSPAPTHARQSTVVRTENVLPAQTPASGNTSDWLIEEPDGSLLRLEDWVLPEPPHDEEATEDPGDDQTGDPGEDLSGEPEEGPDDANFSAAGDDQNGVLPKNLDLRNNLEKTALANEEKFLYNSNLNNAENRDILAFRASSESEGDLVAEDFSVRFYATAPAETRSFFEDNYLIPAVSVEDDLVTVSLSLDESAFTIEQPTDVYIEVAWKTMAAQAVIRLIPHGQESAPLIGNLEEADDVLYVPVKDLSALLALQAEALPEEQLSDWRLRVSFTDTELTALPDETADFRPVNHLGYRTVCEDGTVTLQGAALLSVSEDAAGRLLLDLTGTGLVGKTTGTLRLESFGAALADSLSPMPDAQLRGDFILSPDAHEATLSVDDDWLGCTLSYQLWQLEASGQFTEVAGFAGPETEGESLKLSLDPEAEDRLPAGSYRLTLIWALPGGTVLYERSISFFISY